MFDGDVSKKSLPHLPNFMTRGMIAASIAAAGAMLTRVCSTAYGQRLDYDTGTLTKGDIAILRFLAAVELIESDLWQQYEELGGVTHGSQNSYQLALQFLDGDGAQYITSNTLDEISHATYLNAYLESEGADPVDFDKFRTLRGSIATGAQNIGRLSNLMHLDLDTSWYIRYRSLENPAFGASFPQALRIVNRQAIPRTDADFDGPGHIQAIANTAAFHFGYIEHAGSCLYAHLSQKVRRASILKITLGIGGDEIAHFLAWVDFAASAVQGPPFSLDNAQSPMTDYNLAFRYLSNKPRGPICQTNVNCSVPADFMSEFLSGCPVVRPFDRQFSGAVATIDSFTENGLFVGQSPEFMSTLVEMAEDADCAICN
jgi:hypothetical protein